MDQAIEYTRQLISCRSVTPLEGGALQFLEQLLDENGFICQRLPFSEAGTPDVDNLYARFGEGSPHLMFAGHTDVVPPGDESKWRHDPFAAKIDNGVLYGRGAADMKGAIACFLAASFDYIASNPDFPGSISFLITGDEEGPAINGTRKMLDWLEQNQHIPNHCLVGEPTNPNYLGEAIKIGRRGSLNGFLTIHGTQGHVAYPHLAVNPIDGVSAVLQALSIKELDEGTDHFLPTHLEITSVDVGNATVNVIPDTAHCQFNIRFNDTYHYDSLELLVQGKIKQALAVTGLKFDLRFERSAESFVTEPGPWVDMLIQATQEITGQRPTLSTSGGTSDARFIKNICPVVELGLLNATIHQIDEHAAIEDLMQLTRIYRLFIEKYFQEITA